MNGQRYVYLYMCAKERCDSGIGSLCIWMCDQMLWMQISKYVNENENTNVTIRIWMCDQTANITMCWSLFKEYKRLQDEYHCPRWCHTFIRIPQPQPNIWNNKFYQAIRNNWCSAQYTAVPAPHVPHVWLSGTVPPHAHAIWLSPYSTSQRQGRIAAVPHTRASQNNMFAE